MLKSMQTANKVGMIHENKDKPWQVLWEKTIRVSLPDKWPWFGNKTTYVRVHMCTTLENGILRNGQQLGGAVNSFINQGKFVAKTLSGHKAPRCDKHLFYDKMMASTWTVFEISLLNIWYTLKPVILASN